MAIEMDVARSDLSFEASFVQPEFSLLGNAPGFLHHLFTHLEPHGLQVSNLRIDRGSGDVADFQLVCHLPGYLMTFRARVQRVEMVCAGLPQSAAEGLKSAMLAALRAVREYRPELSFQAFALAIGMHARLKGTLVRDYLGQFVSQVPPGLGPPTGSGTVFYFGPDGNRLLSSLTVDVSAVMADAVYIRLHAIWDAQSTEMETLPALAEAFVRHALDKLGLHLPG